MNKNAENEPNGPGNEEEIKYKKIKIWTIFFIAITGTSTFITFIATIVGLNFFISLAIGTGIWLVTVVTTAIKGYFETPENHRDIVVSFGKYIGHHTMPGPHILFPYFGYEKYYRVYMGTQKIALFLDKEHDENGDIEFQDTSAALSGSLFFQVTDPEKAVFDIDDIIGGLKEMANHIIRAFFGMYTLEDSIQLKSVFRIQDVANLLDVSSDSPLRPKTPEEFKAMQTSDEKAAKTEFYQTLESWGVEPLGLTVTDIVVPENIKEQRNRALIAAKNLEVSKIDLKTSRMEKKITIVKAEAESESLSTIGEGEAARISHLIDSGKVNSKEAVDLLVSQLKWGAIAKNPNVTLIEGSGAETDTGIKMGIGMNLMNKKKG